MQINIEGDSPSLDDPSREELLWSSRSEDLCEGWMTDSTRRSQKHGHNAKAFKIKSQVFGFMNVFFPLLLASSTPFVGQYTILYQVLLFIVSLTAGTATFFKFQLNYARHSEYENRFLEFVDDVRSELCRPKRNRMACDAFLERCKHQHNKLVSSSPDI
jgi:hypothetical protein